VRKILVKGQRILKVTERINLPYLGLVPLLKVQKPSFMRFRADKCIVFLVDRYLTSCNPVYAGVAFMGLEIISMNYDVLRIALSHLVGPQSVLVC